MTMGFNPSAIGTANYRPVATKPKSIVRKESMGTIDLDPRLLVSYVYSVALSGQNSRTLIDYVTLA